MDTGIGTGQSHALRVIRMPAEPIANVAAPPRTAGVKALIPKGKPRALSDNAAPYIQPRTAGKGMLR
jgi:hypothetical protein